MRNKLNFVIVILSFSIFSMTFSSIYADSGSINLYGKDVEYDIENGNLVNLSLDVDFLELMVEFVSSDNGFVQLNIPRDLLDAKLGTNEDDIFFVIVDGFETEYIEIESDYNSRTLIIPFFSGDSQLAIIGTDALVPIEDENDTQIPEWVKNNAGWWASGQIGDSDFVSGIQYLITKGIMTIPETESGQSTNESIPEWVKNNAGWWASGQIEDSDFVSGIQYLITKGIMTV